MNPKYKLAPKSITNLTEVEELASLLQEAIGKEFKIVKAARTDGANTRKFIASILEKRGFIDRANLEEYEIVPPKKKGVPKILLEFIDTYAVTSGRSYNLQVWNRIPDSNALLVKYENGESLKCEDVRFVFMKVDMETDTVSSIIIASPKFIVQKFGRFGVKTIKHQLLISGKVRKALIESDDRIMFFPDSAKLSDKVKTTYSKPKSSMTDEPKIEDLFSLELLRDLVARNLIGMTLDAGATKNRGQALERLTLNMLGYDLNESDLLFGGYPDIRNQLLEVKVQDTQTVDLGKFTPALEEVIVETGNLTTFDVRYLIALTNPETLEIEGVILCPGEKFGDLFSYVSETSYKCQRSIPMSFFESYQGQSVFIPD